MPYGELPPLTDVEFDRVRRDMSFDAFPPAQRVQKTHAYFERLMHEEPKEWREWLERGAQAWLSGMKPQNGNRTQYNPTGRRFSRGELKVMAGQWGSDALGADHAEHAATADELLDRARDGERLASVYHQRGLL